MSDIQSHPEYLALLRAVLEKPEDDAPRLIFADWIEEAGDDVHANYIREAIRTRSDIYPVHLMPSFKQTLGFDWSRGFMSGVRLTSAEFCGGPCGWCSSTGMIGRLSSTGAQAEPCPRCSGAGRIDGIARELFERHPIIRVVLTDQKPYLNRFVDSLSWGWFVTDATESHWPNELWDSFASIWHPTEAAAQDALSDACVRYGRELVGLPSLDIQT